MKEKTLADKIVEKAKRDIIGFITFGVAIIHNAVSNKSEDGETYVKEDNLVWQPLIEVPVNDTYLDVEDYCSEKRVIVEVCVDKDGQSWVKTQEGDVIYCNNLSVEELANIANCLKESVEKNNVFAK